MVIATRVLTSGHKSVLVEQGVGTSGLIAELVYQLVFAIDKLLPTKLLQSFTIDHELGWFCCEKLLSKLEVSTVFIILLYPQHAQRVTNPATSYHLFPGCEVG
jgi:hypothetical protein